MRNLDSTLLFMIDLAKRAGRIQMDYFRNPGLDMHTKSNASDVVTEADKASESLILDAIAATFPGDAVLSEESGASGDEDAEWQWIIDPLDGTTNYSQGLPVFSVSIALAYKGVTQLGVVYAPYLDELFEARKGGGARLNGKAIHCSSKSSLAEAVGCTGMPYDKLSNPDNNLDNISRLAPLMRGLRRLGSAAVDLCYVGAGFLDLYWEMNLNPWDVAAGALVASEAGARVERFRPDRNVSIAAATPALFDEFRSHLRP